MQVSGTIDNPAYGKSLYMVDYDGIDYHHAYFFNEMNEQGSNNILDLWKMGVTKLGYEPSNKQFFTSFVYFLTH